VETRSTISTISLTDVAYGGHILTHGDVESVLAKQKAHRNSDILVAKFR